MDGIRQWAFSVCVAMVACGIARMLLPKSNLQKVFSITVSAFFLCALASPLLLDMPRISVQYEETAAPDMERRAAALEEETASQTKFMASAGVEKIISEKLAEMGINHRDITIHISTSGDSDAAVEQADIVLDAAHEPDHQRIRSRLEEAMGFEIRLGYEESPELPAGATDGEGEQDDPEGKE